MEHAGSLESTKEEAIAEGNLRTLAHEKRSENCLRFATSGPSLCLYSLL